MLGHCDVEPSRNRPDPRRKRPYRDATAIIGEADVLCSRDDDFFGDPAGEYLNEFGITVLDDIALKQRLRL